MDNKYIYILFFGFWVGTYWIFSNAFAFEYESVQDIHIEYQDKMWTNKYGDKSNLKFYAHLTNGNTCQILDMLNLQMINKIVDNIKNLNTKYYTIIELDKNYCSSLDTIKIKVFNIITLKFSIIIMSLILSLIFINVFNEINKYKKNDDVIEDYDQNDLTHNDDFIKNINWLEIL